MAFIFRPVMVAGAAASGWLLHDNIGSVGTFWPFSNVKDTESFALRDSLSALQQLLVNQSNLIPRERVTVIHSSPQGTWTSVIVKTGIGVGILVAIAKYAGFRWIDLMVVSRKTFNNAVGTLTSSLGSLAQHFEQFRKKTDEDFGRVHNANARLQGSIEEVRMEQVNLAELVDERTNRLEAGVSRTRRGIELLVEFVTNVQGPRRPNVLKELEDYTKGSTDQSLPAPPSYPRLQAPAEVESISSSSPSLQVGVHTVSSQPSRRSSLSLTQPSAPGASTTASAIGTFISLLAGARKTPVSPNAKTPSVAAAVFPSVSVLPSSEPDVFSPELLERLRSLEASVKQ